MPIAIVFIVGFIMLFVVGNQIVHRESIVRGHEVDALFGFAITMTINVRAGKKSFRESSRLPLVTFDKRANVVAESAVPFLPMVTKKVADLVQTGRVPSLGDELRTTEYWVRFDIP